PQSPVLRSAHPVDGVYLIAAPFVITEQRWKNIDVRVALLKEDPLIAKSYIEESLLSLEKYSQLLGPYPWPSFTVVENARETGFGMPGFTLLGKKVLRLPFILKTSLPHEILHNWWGNAVYLKESEGNWCEGLTSYLADHSFAAASGRGSEDRLLTLTNWQDYASGGKDFPLAHFRSRHNPATQAVGYGKGQMFFHMLRLELGDEIFYAGLRRFFQNNLFRRAGFSDLEVAFAQESGNDLGTFFQQWIFRKGAPQLHLGGAGKWRSERGWYLSLRLGQSVSDANGPYRLRVPVRIQTISGKVLQENILLLSENFHVTFDLPENPIKVAVDPEFDLFRSLHGEERPPLFSSLLAADNIIHRWTDESLAQIVESNFPARYDSGPLEVATSRLPSGPLVVLSGDPSLLRPFLEKVLAQHGFDWRPNHALGFQGKEWDLRDSGFALIVPHPANSQYRLVWLNAGQNPNWLA
ncbi:MAG: M1 family aminopeptidase, partial [Bdellovibrionaceae bacterium]|nr:M1 family aminopeptidase [Pseudobdellovibrionaceae bacterium]